VSSACYTPSTRALFTDTELATLPLDAGNPTANPPIPPTTAYANDLSSSSSTIKLMSDGLQKLMDLIATTINAGRTGGVQGAMVELIPREMVALLTRGFPPGDLVMDVQPRAPDAFVTADLRQRREAAVNYDVVNNVRSTTNRNRYTRQQVTGDGTLPASLLPQYGNIRLNTILTSSRTLVYPGSTRDAAECVRLIFEFKTDLSEDKADTLKAILQTALNMLAMWIDCYFMAARANSDVMGSNLDVWGVLADAETVIFLRLRTEDLLASGASQRPYLEVSAPIQLRTVSAQRNVLLANLLAVTQLIYRADPNGGQVAYDQAWKNVIQQHWPSYPIWTSA
jgi:hypothetical protein